MSSQPLADLLRPKKIEEVVGQEHLIGTQKPLTKLAESGTLFSMIFWGPPGVGKTTLARILATTSNHAFIEISAVSAGKKDLREVVENARAERVIQLKNAVDDAKPPVLFIDEIHRFNKAQQDFLLPYVERGDIILIGATTENPSFEVISALLSRCRVFTLKPLSNAHLEQLISQAVHYFKKFTPKTTITQDAINWLVPISHGDARHLLTLLDHCYQLYGTLSLENLQATSERKRLSYDKDGDNHYNTISAFIKSMRAGSADAAIYYLARMIDAGEDAKCIARRMIIFASEDIGLAQPTALVVANEVFAAVHRIGLPEAGINLAQGVAYLAQCKKDRRAYDAYKSALADVETYGALPIPKAILNAPTTLMKSEGYGEGYSMYDLTTEELLPENLSGKVYFKKRE